MKYKFKIETGTKEFIVNGLRVSYKKYRYHRVNRPYWAHECRREIKEIYYLEGNKLAEVYKDIEAKMLEFYSIAEHPINPMNDDAVVYDFFNSIRIY